ncbi:MAG: hypothetical protein ACREQQ_04835 [Candidatus Binatia bacterium]
MKTASVRRRAGGLDHLPPGDACERTILEALRRLLGDGRRGRNITKLEMPFVRPPANRGKAEPARSRRRT